MKLPVYLLLFIAVSTSLLSCQEQPGRQYTEEEQAEQEIDYARAEALAKQHCATCHPYTEPGLLDKDTWKYGTLPQMGYRMGIYQGTDRGSLIESNPGGALVETSGIFPKEPLLNEAEWQLIIQHYASQAPDQLVIPKKELRRGIPGLQVTASEFHIAPPMITAIAYHPELELLFAADAKADFSTINILDRQLSSVATLALPSPISHLDFRADTILATLMGGFMPTDNPSGSIVKIFKPPGEKEYKGFTTVLRNLQRPVHTTYTDIDGDGMEDIIVCEYGNHTGKLSLFLGRANGRYEHVILSSDPGATSVSITDMNQDGHPDIVALMAQGRERIDVYYNDGKGAFTPQTLLSFPPAYGSVGLSVLDWNEDGHEDLLYVNGDNADYSMTLKPYHGLRLYLNDGNNHFSEAFFQHQNGAYKALPLDLDRDGDLDIALSAFFPDLIRAPEEGFIFMENTGTPEVLHFELSTIEAAALGRWLTLEAADLDGKGAPELILGAFTGMAITGDGTGAVGANFREQSPTLLLLDFDGDLR